MDAAPPTLVFIIMLIQKITSSGYAASALNPVAVRGQFRVGKFWLIGFEKFCGSLTDRFTAFTVFQPIALFIIFKCR